jgi:glycosyltransferase involved in cell wall biosynthesis
MNVHLVEPGGRGGVYQHTLDLATVLSDAGWQVALHTARDAECLPPAGVAVCTCVDWKRELERGHARSAAIAADYLRATLWHLVRTVERGDVVHVQGLFASALTTLTLAATRARSARVVHSPHNTFSRAGRRYEEFLLRQDSRMANATIVFSEADRIALTGRGIRPIVSPLTQYMPRPETLPTALWHQRWGGADRRPTLLFAGQIRRDKRLDLLLAAAATRPEAWRVVVVGEDKGDVIRCRRLANEYGLSVSWWEQYAALQEFVGAIAAADVVVCPHALASQSGVLALARQLGVPTVASNVGGLPELATVTFARDDATSLARAIDIALTRGRFAPESQHAELLDAHLEAYGVA